MDSDNHAHVELVFVPTVAVVGWTTWKVYVLQSGIKAKACLSTLVLHLRSVVEHSEADITPQFGA